MDFMPANGVFSLLAHATPTVKFVLLVLGAMSVASWSIIITKIFLLSGARKRVHRDLAAFQNGPSLSEGMRLLGKEPSSPIYQAGLSGINELRRMEKDGTLSAERESMVMDNLRRALRQGVTGQLSRLSKSLAFLATCANSAPFIGLFGTVWGIMHSFQAVGRMKTAALAAVAPGISEALIATAIGLAVAIPATIAYNSFLGAINALEAELVGFAGAFLNTVRRELGRQKAGEGRGED